MAAHSIATYYLRLLTANRGWIALAALVFLLGAGWGAALAVAAPEQTVSSLSPILERVGGIGRRVVASPSPVVRTWLIFQNNALATLFILMVSPLAGIVPALALLVNSFALGALLVLAPALAGAAAAPLVLLLGIAPHGLFELPAFVLAAAWGLKLGLAPWRADAEGRRWEVLRNAAVEAVRVYGLVALLLLVAASVEGNVTLWLVRGLRSG